MSYCKNVSAHDGETWKTATWPTGVIFSKENLQFKFQKRISLQETDAVLEHNT